MTNKPSYQELENQIAELKKQNEILLNNSNSAFLSHENHYKFLFDNSTVGFIFCRLIFENNIPTDFIYLEINPVIKKLIGLQNVIGKKFSEVFVNIKEKNIELYQKIRGLALSRKPQKVEIYFEPFEIWLNISIIYPINDYFIAILDNITERKLKEIELLRAKELATENEGKFKILFEQAAVGVAQIDTLSGKFIRINKKYSDIIGYSKQEILNLNFQSITYLPDLKEDLKNMELLKKGEIKEFAIEKRLIHKSGKIIWVRLSVSAMWKHNATPDYHIAVVSDITEQKRNEYELKKLSVAVEQSPVTIAITDILGNIQFVNPAFCKITGYNYDEAIGQNPRVLNSGKTPIETFTNMWQTINSGKTWTGEFINKKKNGTLYYEEAVISPVFNENNEIVNFIAIKNDISDKKQKDELIKKNNIELVELNATKDKFFRIIAHDLRNPFSSILGFSDLLIANLHKYNQEKTLQFVKNINITAQNTYELLENLLEWSSAQTGKIQFKPEKIVLETIVDNVLELTAGNSMAKNIQVNYETNENIEVYADKNMLNTILRNLVTNAIKYTQKNGCVKITASKIEKQILISVTDNGVGMDKNIVDKLFKINEKISTPGTENEQGTGIGLILCKEFVEKHGGTIWAESQINKGSVFMFTLNLE